MSQTIELPVETVARPSQAMPQWSVRLHNDNKNEMVFVVTALVQLVRLPAKDATERTLEAHNHGSAIVFQTHREHAELVRDQLIRQVWKEFTSPKSVLHKAALSLGCN